MRFTFILAALVALAPAALAAQPAPPLQSQATGMSKKKHHKAKAKAPKEEYLKAAPGTGPSGPKN